MSTDPRSSKDGTYLLDSESMAEMARLINLHRFTTKAMGGPLEGLPDLPEKAQVLDIACGPGGWVLDVAFEHPTMEIAGVDISQIMIEYANARARVQKLPNASFGIMDITHPLDFPDNSFDLVNARFLVAVLPRASWPRLLQECYRLTRPGGTFRLTDTDSLGLSNGPAFEHLSALCSRALHLTGYGFSPDGRTFGITPMLERLLHEAGYQNIQQKAHAINFSAGSEPWADFYHNYDILFTLMQPLLLRTQVATQEESDKLYQQAIIEMNADDFCGIWHYLSVWGTKPM